MRALLLALAAAALAAGDAVLAERTGTLAPGDALGPDGGFEDLIAIDLASGPVRVHAASEDHFDLVLRVIAPDGTLIGSEQAEHGGVVAAFTVRAAGVHRVYVGAMHDGASGEYRLRVHGAASAGPTAGDRDLLRVAGGATLAGTLLDGALGVRGAFGVVALPLDRLAGLRREPDGSVVAVLRDGGRLDGVLVGDPLRLRIADGAELRVPLAELGAVERAAAPAPAAHEGPWLVLGGNRVRARWTASTLGIDSHLGELAIPVAAIAALRPGTASHPLGEIQLRDGSRLAGRCLALPLALIDSERPPPAGAGVEVAVPPAPPAFALTLATGDVVVGRPQRLVLASTLGEIAIPGEALSALSSQGDLPELWTVTLASGRAFGRLVGETLTVATTWNPGLAVPRALVRSGGMVAGGGEQGGKGEGAKGENGEKGGKGADAGAQRERGARPEPGPAASELAP